MTGRDLLRESRRSHASAGGAAIDAAAGIRIVPQANSATAEETAGEYAHVRARTALAAYERIVDPAPCSPTPPAPESGAADVLQDARVLIVDDCTLHRENLAALIATNGASEVYVAWDLPSLTEAIRGKSLGVVLLNVATADSAILLRAALDIAPYVQVIVVGVAEDDEVGIVSYAEAGAHGYHTRNESIEDLLGLMSRVGSGESVCSPRVSAILLRRLSMLASQRPLVPDDLMLTAREIEVLEMLELGFSNREIAQHLCIAVHTVKNHVHSLLTKLGVNTRGQAAALAHTVR
jgi:DNA-binding NarL/FixJ family response regulator